MSPYRENARPPSPRAPLITRFHALVICTTVGAVGCVIALAMAAKSCQDAAEQQHRAEMRRDADRCITTCRAIGMWSIPPVSTFYEACRCRNARHRVVSVRGDGSMKIVWGGQ